jgi:hypothetical protein
MYIRWSMKYVNGSWLTSYALNMTYKRTNMGWAPAQYKILEKLSVKLGLDITNTVRYCVARIAEQEGLSGATRAPAKDSQR